MRIEGKTPEALHTGHASATTARHKAASNAPDLTGPLSRFHEGQEEEALHALAQLLQGRRLAILTGAGCSTESGIPDYRGAETSKKKRNPIQYKDFVRNPEARVRYWARSTLGWPRFLAARPNPAHRAIARLEHHGVSCGLITQNVDRLHHAAGSQDVIELHGALAEVTCLSCGVLEPRTTLQQRLLALNPGWSETSTEIAPDGDAVVAPEDTIHFRLPTCQRCGGPLKPNVVFFGENVPKARVEAAWSMLAQADCLLVIGSSLTVFSGYRFVRGAQQQGIPVAIINLGETRGDKHAHICAAAQVSTFLPPLVNTLTAT